MKKGKKLLAGMLSALLLLSGLGEPAYGAPGLPTIDTSKTGSLTIHKYEYNGSAGSEGTGAADDTVPADAVPLPGVTFRVTKVAELSDYYGTDAKELPTVAQAQSMAAIGTPHEETTDSNGKITLTNLPLGLYLVHEVSAPSQITGKTADFLVSIPMTNTDGDGWLYDVHVYPKNSSTYAGVTLLKQGKVGDDAAGTLQGATFVLQKKNEDNTWTTITQNNKGNPVGTAGVLTTGADGRITVSDLAPGNYRFVETGVPSETGFIMDGSATKEFSISVEGKVLVGGTEVDTSQNPITAVNYEPDVEKEVKDRTDGTYGDDSDYSAGDTVPYRITVDIPANIASLREFTLSDTMEHQTYRSGSLKIFSDKNMTTEILAGQYTVDTTTPAWSIAFNSYDAAAKTVSTSLSAYAGKSIYIYYESVLGTDAVVTSAGNPNTVKLDYSNKVIPNTDDGNPNEGGDPGKNTITDQATVYTFQIAVEKVDASDSTKKLQGVTFDLYRKLQTGETVAGKVTNPVSGLTGDFEKVNGSTPLTTDAKGAIQVNGLENGTYYLVETKTSEDYNLLKSPVKVEIAVTYATTTTTTKVTDAAGNTTITTSVQNQTFDNAGSNGVFKTVVKNSKGFTLPITGGMGTVIFTVAGVILMLGGGGILFRTRKKKVR